MAEEKKSKDILLDVGKDILGDTTKKFVEEVVGHTIKKMAKGPNDIEIVNEV